METHPAEKEQKITGETGKSRTLSYAVAVENLEGSKRVVPKGRKKGLNSSPSPQAVARGNYFFRGRKCGKKPRPSKPSRGNSKRGRLIGGRGLRKEGIRKVKLLLGNSGENRNTLSDERSKKRWGWKTSR